MSRTYRRKKATYDFKQYHCHDYKYVEHSASVVFTKVKFEKDSKEYKKAYHRYFGDKKMFGGGVPSKFVNVVRERPFRQKTKKELHKYRKNNDYEVIVPRFIHDAGWHYF